MILLRTVHAMRAWRADRPDSCGFVPTMGALHAGHASLIERSIKKCTATVVSIFVNPTQFNDPKDFASYPNTLEDDLRLLEKLRVDAVFLPDAEEIYAADKRFQLSESGISATLEGKHRPGHFVGVLTVVLKLINIVRPLVAYFGEKDFQQYLLIKNMVEALFINCRIEMSETVRAEDGLALSSRNLRLSPGARERAPAFYQQLRSAPSAAAAASHLSQAGFEVEYIEEHWGRRLGAVNLDGVRLIDNVPITK